ncbi:MAG: iron-containing redox enzyme family protein [Flavobacterium sp.]|nr:iron-containing redox enzyme family protein [Aeromicrobium sp.]
MRTGATSWHSLIDAEPESRDDAHIALWALYELHYRGFDDVDDSLEWNPGAVAVRGGLERQFEAELRARRTPVDVPRSFADHFFSYVAGHDGASLASFIHREADLDQVLEVLRHRSIYHLKESDPVAWVVPRLPALTQAALMELQYDEYGRGNPNQLHAHLFAKGMEASGLRSGHGAYINDVPVEILEQNNAMSLFGLHRRVRGAALGHLAAFEVTSSLPSRQVSRGLTRVGLPTEISAYYDEHVEADAVHEQLAVRTICGSLLEQEPGLVDDVYFGAFTCLDLEDRYARRVLGEWAAA